MDPIVTIKFLLITWLLDVQSLNVLYHSPMIVYSSEQECLHGLHKTREAHERSYAYHLKIRGLCVSAGTSQ
jgi:hypothetical protein